MESRCNSDINSEFPLCKGCQNGKCPKWGCDYKCSVWDCSNKVPREYKGAYLICNHHAICGECKYFIGTKFFCERCGAPRS